jgi:hypothetical protein
MTLDAEGVHIPEIHPEKPKNTKRRPEFQDAFGNLSPPKETAFFDKQ